MKSGYGALAPRSVSSSELERPGEDEVEAATERTRLAIQAKITGKKEAVGDGTQKKEQMKIGDRGRGGGMGGINRSSSSHDPSFLFPHFPLFIFVVVFIFFFYSFFFF